MMCEVCNYEDNRGKMIIICPVCLTNNKLAERKQGALEELKYILDWVNDRDVEEDTEQIIEVENMLEKRIKKLSGETK